MRDPENGSFLRYKTNQIINAKPKWFSRVEKMVNDCLVNSLAPIGATLVASAWKHKLVKSNTRNTVLEPAII